MSVNYFDNASTTKVDSRVLEAMLPYFNELYGNPSSNHNFGKKSKEAIEMARKQVSQLIKSNEKEIIFTSGSTESINLALKGYVESNYNKGNHIITVKTEHKAVLSTCEYLETKGIEVTYLDVDSDGLISIESLKKAIRIDTLLICIMFANNETGIIQSIDEIGKIAKKNNIIFFSDITQAIGKIKIDVQKSNIDMLCFSAHKLNGPKGIGVLYKKKEIELTPLFHGGGQEDGLRPGTYNTPLIIGLGKACEISFDELENTLIEIKVKNKYLIEQLKTIKGLIILGNDNSKLFNIINVYIPGLEVEIFITKSSNFALSNGSACTSQIVENSHVLKAMGLSDKECSNCIRISIDKNTSNRQIDELIEAIKIEIGY